MMQYLGQPLFQSSVEFPSDSFRHPDVLAQEKVLYGMRHRLSELENRKSQLLSELHSTHVSKPECKRNVLTAAMVHGYELSAFFSSTDGGNNIYVTHCKDNFKMTVIMKEGEISIVDFTLIDGSVLTEIQKDLTAVASNVLCPHILLMTIQQFMHLKKFRDQIIHELLMPHKKVFRVFIPQCSKGKGDTHNSDVCAIRAYKDHKPVLDLQWTMSWSPAHHMLLHCLTVLQPTSSSDVEAAIPAEVKSFTEALASQPLYNETEPEFRSYWTDLCKWLMDSNV